MLIIWTAANTQTITRTLGAALKDLRPETPQHKFVAYVDGEIPVPAAGEIVLACGSKCLSELQKASRAQKGRTVTSLREKLLPAPEGGFYMLTFDPNVVASEPHEQQTITWDVSLAARYLKTGSLKPPIGTYKYVASYAPMIERIKKRYAETGKPQDVSCDTETMGFYPWYDDKEIVSISFTDEAGMAELLYCGPKFESPVPEEPGVDVGAQIDWLLNSPMVRTRGQNFKYDLIWIWKKWNIECTNFKFDGMLAGTLLDENRSNSLNHLAKTKTEMGGYDDAFNDKYDKGKMETIPPGDDFLTYAGGDTDAAQRVCNQLRNELAEDGKLTDFYVTILHPAARAFERVERRGVYIDQQKFAVLRDDLSTAIKNSEQTCIELLPTRMKIKYRDRITEQLQAGKSPMLPSILKDFFFSKSGLDLKPLETTAKSGEPSMAKAHLRKFGDVPEAKAMVEALTTLDTASKTRSTFVDGFQIHIRPDGLIHPTYFLGHSDFEEAGDTESGTTTGRLSCKNPAFQIIPKKTKWAKRIRECYVAPKGKKMLNLDFSQGELRVVACIANEQQMIAAYEKKLDLHAVTGAQLCGKPLEEFLLMKDSEDPDVSGFFKLMRDRAKPANFGLLYGMSAEGFQAYAWNGYGLKLTLKEAEDIRAAFFALYPGLPGYHDAITDFVRKYEHVRSPLGRVRHLPAIKSWDQKARSDARRQAINAPVQSTLTDMMCWSIAEIEANYGANDDIAIVGMVHDAMIAYVDEDQVALRAGQAQQIMMNLPFHKLGWDPVLNFPADAEAGYDMANLKEIKQAA
jgi:DNA polymerase I-like protein with 3'-5' exonuclease and polymerase domains